MASHEKNRHHPCQKQYFESIFEDIGNKQMLSKSYVVHVEPAKNLHIRIRIRMRIRIHIHIHIHVHIHIHIHVHVHIRIHLQVNFVVLDAEKPENAKLVGLFRVDAIPHFAFIRCCLSVCVSACVHTHISICTRKRPLSRRRHPPFCLDQARARALSLSVRACVHIH